MAGCSVPSINEPGDPMEQGGRDASRSTRRDGGGFNPDTDDFPPVVKDGGADADPIIPVPPVDAAADAPVMSGGMDAGPGVPDPMSGIALGAYIKLGNLYAPGSVKAMDDFATLIGGRPRIIMWYQDWIHFAEFQVNEMRNVLARGATPMLTWEPWDSGGGAGQSKYKLSAIIRGDFDAFIERWAKAAKDFGQVFYLRFAHESNGNWYPWGTGSGNPNGNSTADYKNAWRHVHAIFTRVGVTNARWVFSPNISFTGSSSMYDQYPGDAYVDAVALDGYNWGGSKLPWIWQSFEQVFETSYKQLTAFTQKPLLIGETASTEAGGNKASWIRNLPSTLRNRFPRVRGLIWFNELKETDWQVNSSAGSLQAFKELVKNPAFQLGQ